MFSHRSTTISASRTPALRRAADPAVMSGPSFLLMALLLTLLPVPGAFAAPPAQVPPAQPLPAEVPAFESTFEQSGVSVAMRLSTLDAEGSEGLREGEDVAFEFEIRDAAGEPMSGAFPAAWMDLLPVDEGGSEGGAETDDAACRDKLGGFVSGSLLFQPELDLNVYYVLTLNRDASVSVVDPLFGFGGSKLLDMVLLDSPGFDWALTPDQTRLFVSMPDSDAVAVVDTADWQVLTHLRVGPRPTRLALQDDGSHLWVAYGEGTDEGVAVLRVENLRPRADLRFGPEVSPGKTPEKAPEELVEQRRQSRERPPFDFDSTDRTAAIAFSEDQSVAYLTRPRSGGVAVVDIHELELIETVETGAAPSSIAWSDAARMVYVAHADGSIVALGGGTKPRIVARMQGDVGPGPVRFAPGGRWGFVPVPGADTVHIIDAAKNRIIQTADVESGPDQVTFSDELAYIRHRGSEIVLTIPLHQVGVENAAVPVIDFPGGQSPPGRTDRPSLADGIVQAPGADAVLVANSEDEMIYFYKEGMAAPMGSFKNYGRQPRAVEVVDRSLRERRPGVYRTEAALRRPGVYDVAFFMDAPRTLHCFRVEVAPNPELAEARRRAQPLLVESSPVKAGGVGQTARLSFTLRDPHTEEPVNGLEDVTVLTFVAPGTWQRRHAAVAAGAAGTAGEGVYEVDFEPPVAGVYYAFVGVPSRGLSLRQAPPVIFQVSEEGGGAPGP